jgi:tRNA(His) 5'-end guanylyltransferase
MRVSEKNPLVIRLDGKNVTKNKKNDLLNNYNGTFINSLEKTAKYFSRKISLFFYFRLR